MKVQRVRKEPTKEPPLTLDQFAELLGLFIGVLVFIILLGVDIVKARKKRVHWVPGHALVLTALTIQVMGLLNAQSTLLKEILDNPAPLYGELVKDNLYMIHSSRVMLCVILAYLLPGVARPGYEDSWGKLIALGPTMFVHILSELFTVHRRLAKSGVPLITYSFYFWSYTNELTQFSFLVSSAIISFTLGWLLLLLSSATIANQSIRDIIAQKIPIILASQGNATENSSQAVEDQVLKSWMVSRACYNESIFARSVIATAATIAVTICGVFSIAGWIIQGPVIYLFPVPKSRFKFITTLMEVIFIIVGWATLGWRCLTSVAYYGRWQSWNPEERWYTYFKVEDFWTRYIVQLQEAASMKEKSKVDKEVNKMIGSEGMEIPFLWAFLGALLRCVYWLQCFIVLTSKLCWFIAEFVLDNRCMHSISSKFLSKQGATDDEAFLKYEAILKNVDLLWGNPRTVFVTNRNSIKQAKELKEDGKKDGSNCITLIKFLRDYRKSTGIVGIRSMDPATSQNRTGLKFLGKRDPSPGLKVEEHYIYASKPSFKLTAVSLINIIVRLSPVCGRDALKAYSEACDLMDLVEDSDPASDSLQCKAADSVFRTLQEQTAEDAAYTTSIIPMEDVAAIIENLAKESEAKVEVIEDGGDSLNWKKAGAANALYKLCKSIDCSSTGNSTEVENELQSALADIIGGCIESVGATLMDNCTKWAKEFQEGKLLKAVYIAAKHRALMEQLRSSPTTTESSTAVTVSECVIKQSNST